MVWVKQLVHVVGGELSPPAPCRLVLDPCLDPPGDEGRLGMADENPDMLPTSGGELGSRGSLPINPGVFGVDATLEYRLRSWGRCSDIDIDCTEWFCLLKDPAEPSHSRADRISVAPPIVTCFRGKVRGCWLDGVLKVDMAESHW